MAMQDVNGSDVAVVYAHDRLWIQRLRDSLSACVCLSLDHLRRLTLSDCMDVNCRPAISLFGTIATSPQLRSAERNRVEADTGRAASHP